MRLIIAMAVAVAITLAFKLDTVPAFVVGLGCSLAVQLFRARA